MTYKGHIKNGKVVLDDPMDLPEGATVRIELAIVDSCKDTETFYPTLAESLASVIGKAEGLPEDWSENHDKYLREEYGQ